MAYELDDKQERSRRREIARQQREKKLRRAKWIRWITFGAIVLVSCLVLIIALTGNSDADPSAGTTGTTAPPVTTAPPATTAPRPVVGETVINLAFGGDVNITDKVVGAGENGGNYDYTNLLMDIAPLFSQADAAFLNLEGSFCGAPYGSAQASAPGELANALAAAGIDFVQLANSRTIANGLTGLSSTVSSIASAGMQTVGVFTSDAQREESQGFTLVNIGGIRVAIVAFTKGLDGMTLPAGSESCVNLLYKDYASTYQEINTEGIQAILQAAAAQEPDITIAMVHWGSEYNDSISPTQEAIVELMQAQGVDAIVGTHPHFVQAIDYDPAAGTVVAYSLGDLVGDAEKAGTNYSIILQLEITRNNATGETKITGCDHTGVYTLTPEKDEEAMRIVRISTAMAMYENNHVGKISQLAYENMKYALQRIASRVQK